MVVIDNIPARRPGVLSGDEMEALLLFDLSLAFVYAGATNPLERRDELCLVLDAMMPDHGMSLSNISCLAEILKDSILLDSPVANGNSPRTFITQEHLNPIVLAKTANGNSNQQFYNLVHGYLEATGDNCLVPYLVEAFAYGSTIGEIRAECVRLHLERIAIDLTDTETLNDDGFIGSVHVQDNTGTRGGLCSGGERLWSFVTVLALITVLALNTSVKFPGNQLEVCDLATILRNGCDSSKNPISKTVNTKESGITITEANKCELELFEPVGAVTFVVAEPTELNEE